MGGKGRSQETGEEAAALVQVSDDGDSYWSYGEIREVWILSVF